MLFIFFIFGFVLFFGTFVSKVFRLPLLFSIALAGLFFSFIFRELITSSEIVTTLEILTACLYLVAGISFGRMTVSAKMIYYLLYVSFGLLLALIFTTLLRVTAGETIFQVFFLGFPSIILVLTLFLEEGIDALEAQFLSSLLSLLVYIAVFAHSIFMLMTVFPAASLSSLVKFTSESFLKTLVFFGLMYILTTLIRRQKFMGKATEHTLVVTAQLLGFFTLFFAASGYLSIPLPLIAFFCGTMLSSLIDGSRIGEWLAFSRRVLILLFFSVLGLTVNRVLFLTRWPELITISLVLMLARMLVSFPLFRLMRFPPQRAFSLSILSSAVGETGWIISFAPISLVGERVLDLPTAMWVLTTLFTLYAYSRRVKFFSAIQTKVAGSKLGSLFFGETVPGGEVVLREGRNHIVIIGFGTTARLLVYALRRLGIEYVFITNDWTAARLGGEEDMAVLIGDPTSTTVLEKARLRHAGSLLVTTHDQTLQGEIITKALTLSRGLKIFCLVGSPTQRTRLKALGAFHILHEEQELVKALIAEVVRYKAGNEDLIGKVRRLSFDRISYN